jgi:putative AbiEi antitoxin of type IV toxin-antitoxin system
MSQATVGQLAAAFGISVRQVDKLADRGVVVRVRHGVFDLEASIQGYIKHRTEDAANRATGRIGHAAASASNGNDHEARLRSADEIERLAHECNQAFDRLRAEPDVERRRVLARSGILGCVGALDDELERSRGLLSATEGELVKAHLDRIVGRAVAEILCLCDWRLEEEPS